ncbi:hypothetical protein MTR67_028853 [Solanum verrucosum]|uniref:Reverse transcriptase zinc-binding domain-containing protein n=1 Tax=Solanum verrucosum TaxID=315347 RepID=A0AAF0U0P6_SOLVR|nr:hypothetical protein MTR67_028853 [Solanum verrucosum]
MGRVWGSEGLINGPRVVAGDVNVVRFPFEKKNCNKFNKKMEEFSEFIVDMELQDLPLVDQRILSDDESYLRAVLTVKFEENARREEVSWRQRSRAPWLKEGDIDSTFFHRTANCHKRYNNIDKQIINGSNVTEPAEIRDEVTTFYQKLYTETEVWRPKFNPRGDKADELGLWKEIIIARYSKEGPWTTQRKTMFWNDVLVGQTPLRQQFPDIYNLNQQKLTTILEFYNTLEQAKSLNFEEDRLLWKLNKDSKFRVKAAYKLLDISTETKEWWPWKMIWKGKIPHKVDRFTWLVANQAVLTLDNLMKRGRQLCSKFFL